MKLARIGRPAAEVPAVLDGNGAWRDLSGHVADIGVPELDRIAEVDLASLPLIAEPVRFGPPLRRVGKFIAIGLNYADHARESGMPIPAEPTIFMKSRDCIGGPDDDVALPRGSTMMDWEVELGIVIGTRARYVEVGRGLSHVAGYVLVNDLSERNDQLNRGGTWDKGKSHDGFGPIGPFLVTRDELGDARGIALKTSVNGRLMQDGTTADMIFGVAEIVACVSQYMTLLPGDIITTGTPAGVGMGMRPSPVFLKENDVLELSGGPLGTQRQRILPPVSGDSDEAGGK
ncbi:MAG TPA: fumarylacetoacetate hydrolase family protein [Allosphingosinicella sp.]|nr:fumarylacetoacetate hydrolase family protein [Allosphingosinicella sp.]